MTNTPQAQPATHAQVLAAAVSSMAGQPRPGQQQMADAVAACLASQTHLLVQAGTGTGKSLGYLAPSLVWATQTGQRVIVATATLALQNQLANKDVPIVLDAVEQVTGKRPVVEVLKGRANYACLLRSRDQVGADQASLISAGEVAETLRDSGAAAGSVVGAQVVALREWVEQQLADDGSGDRDEAPTHTQRAWAQVSVPVRECIGAQNCRYGPQCFVEESRARARLADLVITNHALLAIDAMHDGAALPQHSVVIIDEAHELTSRVTGAASAELSPQTIERVARRCAPWLDEELNADLAAGVDALVSALASTQPGRITEPQAPAVTACALVQQVTRQVITKLGQVAGQQPVERTQASAAVQEIFDVAERVTRLSGTDVVWMSEREQFGRQLNVAPLSVAGLLREKVLGEATTVLTSATLIIGGGFGPVAASVGLRRQDRVQAIAEPEPGTADQTDHRDLHWCGLDVGSPFDYRHQGIMYLASHLPNPGRDGIGPQALAEVAELLWAAGGRTLGLFASQRSAEATAAFVRKELPSLSVLCQGDAQLSDLTSRFTRDERSCLFGTLSLWQGIDVPGDTCRLVIIDKIPFPRPDDPLLQARQQEVTKAGGNGFMQVAAFHAGLLMAQGAGRLIRGSTDRGVVAVLDPRLATANYGPYLLASMPDFWITRDHEVAIAALRRLDKPS